MVLMASLALPVAAAAQTSVQIVPAYTGQSDNLIVVRSYSPSCAMDTRPDQMITSMENGVLTISMPPAPPQTICTAVVAYIEVAWTFRDLGLEEFPDQLTVQFGTSPARGSFRKVPAFSSAARLAEGWWKSYNTTLSWQLQGNQIGALILAHDDQGRSTWRVGGGDFAAGRGSVALYDSVNGETLHGTYAGSPGTVRDGNLDFAFEGPALAWVRYGNSTSWRPARPYSLGEDLQPRGGYFGLNSSVDITGGWHLAAALGGGKVEILLASTDPFEDYPRYIARINGQQAALSCDFDSCVFDAALGAPLGGIELPVAGMTATTLWRRSATAWEQVLLRD